MTLRLPFEVGQWSSSVGRKATSCGEIAAIARIVLLHNQFAILITGEGKIVQYFSNSVDDSRVGGKEMIYILKL